MSNKMIQKIESKKKERDKILKQIEELTSQEKEMSASISQMEDIYRSGTAQEKIYEVLPYRQASVCKMDEDEATRLKNVLIKDGFPKIAECVQLSINAQKEYIDALSIMKECDHDWSYRHISDEELAFNGARLPQFSKIRKGTKTDTPEFEQYCKNSIEFALKMARQTSVCTKCGMPYKYSGVNIDKAIQSVQDTPVVTLSISPPNYIIDYLDKIDNEESRELNLIEKSLEDLAAKDVKSMTKKEVSKHVKLIEELQKRLDKVTSINKASDKSDKEIKELTDSIYTREFKKGKTL